MSSTSNKEYYDAFADRYDHGRDAGYHKLLDDQATSIVRRVAKGKAALEVGCGTGLILKQVADFTTEAKGVDLSPGMLERARSRGLDVQEASATALPFPDSSFDVAYSFKVLAHIPDLETCLSEMVRVVRPGGFVVFDAYNRQSLRYLAKRVLGHRETSKVFDEGAITTRFSSNSEIVRKIPQGASLTRISGIRILVPHPKVVSLPVVGRGVRRLEWSLMDSRLSRFAGFTVFTIQRHEHSV